MLCNVQRRRTCIRVSSEGNIIGMDASICSISVQHHRPTNENFALVCCKTCEHCEKNSKYSSVFMHLEVFNILLISWTDTVESKLFVVRQLQTDIQVQLILLQDS